MIQFGFPVPVRLLQTRVCVVFVCSSYIFIIVYGHVGFFILSIFDILI